MEISIVGLIFLVVCCLMFGFVSGYLYYHFLESGSVFNQGYWQRDNELKNKQEINIKII